jgi:hypothetical protein
LPIDTDILSNNKRIPNKPQLPNVAHDLAGDRAPYIGETELNGNRRWNAIPNQFGAQIHNNISSIQLVLCNMPTRIPGAGQRRKQQPIPRNHVKYAIVTGI